MKISPQDRHVTRRGLFSPSSGRVVSEVMKPRAEMTLNERIASDRRAVTRSLAEGHQSRILADQRTVHRVYENARNLALQVSTHPLARHRPLSRSQLSRRTFLAASAATIATTKAFADTAFSSFAFPGTNRTRSRTTPDRIADIFNVLDFSGIDPTGSADCAPAINAAVTASGGNGTIFFPKQANGSNAAYKVNSAVLIPNGSSLQFIGQGNGTNIFGNFNGFILDNLSSPYNPAGAPSEIKRLNISNGHAGNCFAVTANGNWSAGSSVTITLSGSNPGVAVGGALWTADARSSTCTLFVGMITAVSWPNVTVATAAIGSGGHSDLGLKVIQCYAAGASWLAGATSITMASTPPAGISGQYYFFDYEYFLSDRLFNGNFGVGTWSGTTFTFTAGTSVIAPSVGSSDRIWFAPVAGGIRYSSVAGAIVENCFIQGAIGLTSSEDKIVANDPTLGGAEGFHIKIDTCAFSSPSGCPAVPGNVGVYIQNNSQIINITATGLWCGVRLSGAATAIFGGQFEVSYFGIIIGGDFTATNNSAGDVFLAAFSMESNLLGIYASSAGLTSIKAVGVLCNAPNPIGGIYINAMNGVIEASGAIGNFETGYAIYIADPGSSRGSLKLTATFGINQSNSALSWRIPVQAWWGTCEQSNNPALVYLYANLPGVGGNPDAVEGDEFNISNSNTATWGATVAAGGSNRIKTRYNGTAYTVVGK